MRYTKEEATMKYPRVIFEGDVDIGEGAVIGTGAVIGERL